MSCYGFLVLHFKTARLKVSNSTPLKISMQLCSFKFSFDYRRTIIIILSGLHDCVTNYSSGNNRI